MTRKGGRDSFHQASNNLASTLKREISKSFTLSDGVKVYFEHQIIMHSDIASTTFIDERVNGRPQALLSPTNLAVISRSLVEVGQFYPGYGYLDNETGKLGFIDGSRRLKGAEYGGSDYESYITKQQLTLEQLIELRHIIQSAKQPCDYDIGLECKALKEEGLNGKEIAEKVKISESKVSRVLKSAEAPAELLRLFDDYTILTRANFETLVNIKQSVNETTPAAGVSKRLDELATLVEMQLTDSNTVTDDAYSVLENRYHNSDMQAERVLKVLKKVIVEFNEEPPKTSKLKQENLLKGKSNKQRLMYRETVNSRGFADISFVTRDFPKDLQNKLKEHINQFIKDNFAD
jgi:ParB-like chromosome segregation protein Spo0J